MSSGPLVSVVIPVRNGEKYIASSIRSIHTQSFQDFELILVDNGSSDGTVEVCEQMSDERTRLEVFDGKPSIANALNRGLEVATGRYIARLDSDDIARSDRLVKQVQFLDANPTIGIVGSWLKTFGTTQKTWKYPIYDHDLRLAMLFRSPFGHPSVMFRARWESGEKVFYDSTWDFAEDLELWSRMLRRWGGHNLNECLTFYRTHPLQFTRFHDEERKSLVAEIIRNYAHETGLENFSPHFSARQAFVWWTNTEKKLKHRESFRHADWKKLRWENTIALLRFSTRRLFGRLRLLRLILFVRNSLERTLRSSGRSSGDN